MTRPFDYTPPEGPPKVLHQDAHVLVVDKPSGLLSVPGRPVEHRDCLIARLQARDPAVLLVHRLDMDTSGVMVFARNKAAQRHLGLQFERRVVKKTYEALVWGQVADDAGQVALPLIVDWPNRPLHKVCHDTGKPALTRWHVAARLPDRTRMTLRPETGRSHQLRVHMRALGHAICGDPLYADGDALAAADRLCLHATRLQLRHPDGGAWLTIDSPAPF